MRGLILMIGDDFEEQGMLRARLNSIGFNVIWVHAATILGNQWVKTSQFEGIILNFDMQHHNGMAVLESLHKLSGETPVIVMSCLSTHERLEETLRKGARDYVSLPEDIDLLREKCLRHFQVREETPHDRPSHQGRAQQ